MNCSSPKETKINNSTLSDNNTETELVATNNELLIYEIEAATPVSVKSYTVYNGGDVPMYDPTAWTVEASSDGTEWIQIDSQQDQKFCARYQPNTYIINNPSNYKFYRLQIQNANNDTVKLSEIVWNTNDLDTKWTNFKYPAVEFKNLNPNTEGAKLYEALVQDPDAYIKDHAKRVAEILYFSENDSIVNVENIEYILKEYDGVSAKGGSSPNINIVYSTKHVEKAAAESMHKLDFETRGVLYHELTHAYQYEPKGCGDYGSNKTFWAFIEGMADAVRAESGFFDMSTRKPGGNWMDGYRTTGFFIQWFKTKDPDGIKKFHKTAAQLDVWNFDDAVKLVFGPDTSVQQLWDEYQNYLVEQANN